MAAVTEIYNFIGQTIADDIADEWQQAVLNIEKLENSVGFDGYYRDETGEKIDLELEAEGFDLRFSTLIQKLHSITTAENSNHWNRLRYTLYPDRSFEVEFIWDEDLAEEMAYITATMDVPEPRRGDGLDDLKTRQLERKTTRIYEALAQALLHNAPAEDWQLVLLTLTQPPVHYAAEVQRAPGRRAALLLLGEAEAIQALVDLTQAGNHLRWEKAHVAVQPTGHYRFSFEWAGAGEYNLPTLYHREGQVDVPPALA